MANLERYRGWLLDLSPRLSGTDTPFRATAFLINASGFAVRSHNVAVTEPHDFLLRDDAVERARLAARAWIDADHVRADGI